MRHLDRVYGELLLKKQLIPFPCLTVHISGVNIHLKVITIVYFMRYLTAIILLYCITVMPCSNVYAGVAEASTGPDIIYTHQYDLSSLSPEEREWFNTFLEGTFFADGWQEISHNILLKMDAQDREAQRAVLNRLGYKIGLEWCKDNDDRKISTPMLKKWGDKLQTTAEEEPRLLTEVLKDIDCEVDSLLH